MVGRHFTVCDGIVPLASGMTFEMAITFVTGFYYRFYNEKLHLEIVEEYGDKDCQDVGGELNDKPC